MNTSPDLRKELFVIDFVAVELINAANIRRGSNHYVGMESIKQHEKSAMVKVFVNTIKKKTSAKGAPVHVFVNIIGEEMIVKTVMGQAFASTIDIKAVAKTVTGEVFVIIIESGSNVEIA